jgi:hypothetical protein
MKLSALIVIVMNMKNHVTYSIKVSSSKVNNQLLLLKSID